MSEKISKSLSKCLYVIIHDTGNCTFSLKDFFSFIIIVLLLYIFIFIFYFYLFLIFIFYFYFFIFIFFYFYFVFYLIFIYISFLFLFFLFLFIFFFIIFHLFIFYLFIRFIVFLFFFFFFFFAVCQMRQLYILIKKHVILFFRCKVRKFFRTRFKILHNEWALYLCYAAINTKLLSMYYIRRYEF